MIQELLGSGLISGERRINPITTNGTILQPPPTTYSYHNSSPSSSSSTTTTPTTTTTSTTLAGAISGTGTAHHHSLTNSSTLASSSSSLGAAAAGGGGGGGEHLRCPRCDSSNTKFCYYNNYNLTQPRHFCKTCRRYWTKGGALRNVPIGGGCRKNKSTSSGLITSSSSSSVVLGSTFGKPTPTTATNKLKSLAVDFGSSSSSSSPSLFGASLYDLHHLQHNHHHHHQDLPSNSPILWASPQTNNSHHHHFLSLLRSSPPNPQNPNPNPSSTTSTLSPPPTSSSVKDELANSSIGSLFGTTSHHMKMFEPQMPARTLGGWDTSSVNSHDQAPNFLGLNYPPIPIWKGDSNGNGYLVGSCDEPHDHHNDNVGMQEVYQRLKASTGGSSYDVFNDDNNNVGTTSSSSTVAPVAGGGGGFVGYSWNPAAFTSSTATTTTGAASWSDLPTTANNGTAYP